MNETKYHLFKVYDYKGGELSTELNLSKIHLIREILESFIDTDFFYEAEDDGIILTEEDIVKHFKNVNNLPEFGIYAGGDSYVAELYYTATNGDLEEINITQFIKDNVSDFAKILNSSLESSDCLEEESTEDYDRAIALNNSKAQALV